MRDRFRGERGAFNFVTFLLVAGLAAAGYFGYVFVPLYLDNYAVKKAIHTAANAAYSDRRVETVIKVIMNGVDEAEMQDVIIARDGSVMKRPLEFTSENYVVGFTQVPPAVSIEVNYDRHYVMPFTKKEKVMHFHLAHTEDLSPIKY